jgi:membrane fusion protein (multidrug efflux system)
MSQAVDAGSLNRAENEGASAGGEKLAPAPAGRLVAAPPGKTAPPGEKTVAPGASRKRTPRLIAAMALAAGTIAGGWYVTHLGQESTDDAQVEGRVMNVAARISGQVIRVHVEDNQTVDAGDVLVELDPADLTAKVDVARADVAAAAAAVEGARSSLSLVERTAPAGLAEARGSMTSAASSVVAARAAIEQARAEVTAAESRKALSDVNLKRAAALFHSAAVAQAELDARQTEYDEAAANTERARARFASAEAALSGSGGSVALARGRLDAAASAPEQIAAARAAVSLAEARALQTKAALELAQLNASYAVIRASRRGVVSRRTVEEGQTVSPDRPLMAIVPLDDVWVVANFKEDQLAKMREGQRATVELDTYGRHELRGHVESIAGGTGARFALLPPDNATGNFVKVVQRVPVLVRLDKGSGFVLRPGMSADVTVWTSGS